MQTLGASKKIPAIGGAINYDNLLKLWIKWLESDYQAKED
jgi:hypothetical protein